MSDLIDRQAAIDAIGRDLMGGLNYARILKDLPTAEPHNFDEWCEDCKEYDHEKHCCPRFNRVIRTAMEEAKGEAE